MQRYSIFSLARHALSGHRGWLRAWREADLKRAYNVIVIGGGGHGLATAYYLAKEQGVPKVAVLEKGWLGGGNTGGNIAIVRSNDLLPANARFYEFSLTLWERLSQDLNYNVMLSRRGVLDLAHSDAQLEALSRHGNAMRHEGIDAELLTRDEVLRLVPLLDGSDRPRFPVLGGLLQPRGGTARHDAVAWGYARAADAHGVDIVQNCEVTGIRVEGGRVKGVDTTRGPVEAERVAIAVPGHSGQLAALAGLRLPIETHLLQAMVSEPLKPVLDTVVTYGVGHFCVSQSDKGELVMGGGLDGYNSYGQRGNLPALEEAVASGLQLFPFLSRLRMMRHWAGPVDMTMDGSPIIAKLPIEGLYLDGGWCHGGFTATPGSGWLFAYTIANDRHHELNEPFGLDRFASGKLIDESGAGPVPNAH